MPNHVHALSSFINSGQGINTIIGNGKRFMAYEIVKRLHQNGATELLQLLGNAVEAKRKENNQQHNVWELSFDWKQCRSKEFCWQKPDYIHNNPCTGKWQLALDEIACQHRSAKYYLTGEQGVYATTNFMEMQDVDFK